MRAKYKQKDYRVKITNTILLNSESLIITQKSKPNPKIEPMAKDGFRGVLVNDTGSFRIIP